MNDLNRQQRKAGKTELYRHFDAQGSLLYVGISLSTAKRMGEHRCGSEWWKKVASITIQRFPTRKAALDAERKAVQTENPKHNVTGKKRGFRIGGSTEMSTRSSGVRTLTTFAPGSAQRLPPARRRSNAESRRRRETARHFRPQDVRPG